MQICAAYKPAYIYGGPTMSVSKLCEELTKAGQDITVLATTANGKEELNVPAGEEQLVDDVKVYYFKRWTKDHIHFSPSLLWFLHKEIKSTKRQTPKPELVIHIHAWWNLVSIFSCLVAKLHGVKVVLSPRGMLTNYSLNNRNSKFKDGIHFFLGKQLLKYCHIHATSEKEQRDVKQTSEVNGITVIPNFVRFPKYSAGKNLSNTEPSSESEPNSYKLIFLSRIEEKKGLELLFEALAKIAIPYQLSIAGTGDTAYIQSLQSLATKLNVQDQVNWLGHVENQYKFDLIAKHDLLVLTSYNENFANVVIESLAMGTPVLLSDEVGLADYVIENNLGWVTPPTSVEIIKAIELSYTEKFKRDVIRSNAPSVIEKDFDDQELSLSYINMYNTLD
ncbi:XrtY-associated glycosyltransferase XYAG1 [Pedobacter sp. ASV28]|uniref:XrtY-associated glycosyltransferase XYAG1 n=1 Tax=Pedobacter sp. ASV28 TaxID=2795123 RepID=UPI00351C5712